MTGSSKATRPSGGAGKTLLAKCRKLDVATVVESEGLGTTSRKVLHQQARTYTTCGTPEFMSPEMCVGVGHEVS